MHEQNTDSDSPTLVCDKLHDSGYWNPEWDSFTELDPL